MIGIGYYQSIERAHRATVITLLRGILFMLVGFLVLPILLDVKGIWLADPSPDRQPLSARKAETEVLNLPKSALLLWRTFGLVRRPYDYLNLKLSTIFAGQKEQINYGSLYREILPKV